MKILTPNQVVDSRTKALVIGGTVLILLLLWTTLNSTFLPQPLEILFAAYDLIATKELVWHFVKSITLCFKAIAIATVFSMLIAYLSTIPVFKPFTYFLTKFRFLPSVGLSFLFMKISYDVDQQKMYMLTFGIAAFLTDAVFSTVALTTQEEINYARTLKMNPWQTLWEVIIVGKLSNVFEAIRQNFAIAWMMLATVENLCKSQGGIGVMLFDLNKWFKFEYVYAIQVYILLTGILLDISLTKLKYFLFPYSLLSIKK